ncbi:MAG TPA: flagellar type III secretion system pore protein FliP [Acidiphilium sp.]|nr:MAG: flagellar biosynthetic protein FliP [Acidiphilium sp. 21-60-14]OYV91115.1 MAG: flagellar biosynthetic protein FliP [Acidiphilium sp. 37-60-79]HQT86985.1 flagellar type III secretion system pore protein FliP [Acidiphilium sp.]HQU22968.1 flagellar type III secretion system pore protein FliP [Acidiphilium sp.]
MKRRGARLALVLMGALMGVLALPAMAMAAPHTGLFGMTVGKPDAPETARLVQLVVLIGVIALAPSLLVMLTAFTRIVIVLSILRNAMGTQTTPPNSVLIGLALFLTYFVMQPVLHQAWQTGLLPMSQGTMGTMTGLQHAAEPFRQFLAANARPSDIRLFLGLGHLKPPAQVIDTPWRALIPGFVIGEMRRGFEMGFMIYLPFLIIDLVVSSILMSLGMMMLPPTSVSLPFKLLFFVMIDGWHMICGSLVQSFPLMHF